MVNRYQKLGACEPALRLHLQAMRLFTRLGGHDILLGKVLLRCSPGLRTKIL